MEFQSKEHLNVYLKNLKFLDFGSQGNCYLSSNEKKVFKIFHDFYEEDEEHITYTKEGILKFSDVKTKTFIFPEEVCTIKKDVVGHISKYANAKNLYKINPLNVNLNTFNKALEIAQSDMDIISNKQIEIYDLPYNILYNKNFYVVDEEEYNYSYNDINVTKNKNNRAFDTSIYLFLIDTYFNEVVEDNKVLKELYNARDISSIIFLKELRNRLSELSGAEINYLRDAKKYCNKKKRDPQLIREL